MHQEQRLPPSHTGPRRQTNQVCARLRPKAAERPAVPLSPKAAEPAGPAGDSGPKLQKEWPHATGSQSCRPACPTRLSPKAAGPSCGVYDLGPNQQKDRQRTTQAQSLRSADQTPGCLPGTTPKSTSSEQLLHSPCELCRAYWLSRTKAEHPAEGSCRGRGDCIPLKDSTQQGAELPHSNTESP